MTKKKKKTQLEELGEQIQYAAPQFPYNDEGMALRFCHLNKSWLINVDENDKWIHWNDLIWEIGVPGQVHKGIRLVEETIKQEEEKWATLGYQYVLLLKKAIKENIGGESLSNQEIQKRVDADELSNKAKGLANSARAMIKYLCSDRGNAAMMRMVKRNGILIHKITEFDSKGHFLGVENGILNMKTLELVVGKPEYMITKQAKAKWDNDAQCPNWIETINSISGGDQEFAKFLQRVAGSMLLEEKKNKMIICHSPRGGYNKSTFVDTIVDVCGDYGKCISSTMITSQQSSREYYLATLRNLRVASMNETNVDSYLAGDLVKNLIDSGPQQARDPAGKPFEVDPKMTVILTTNHIPNMGGDDALWRRLLIVPFINIVPIEKRNPNFRRDKLVCEYDGILKWMVDGCIEYQQIGFAPPAFIQQSTKAEMVSQDKIQLFNDQFCVATGDENDSISLVDYRSLYVQWCASCGVKPESSIALNKKLTQKEFNVRKQGANVLTIVGIKWACCVDRGDLLNNVLDKLERQHKSSTDQQQQLIHKDLTSRTSI